MYSQFITITLIIISILGIIIYFNIKDNKPQTKHQIKSSPRVNHTVYPKYGYSYNDLAKLHRRLIQ